jgi:hypothetical protein
MNNVAAEMEHLHTQARSSSERRVRGNALARCGEGWAETCGSNAVTRRPSTP